jgi:hypothetical protein
VAKPNHFIRPVQSDRMSQSYGNTHLGSDEEEFTVWSLIKGLSACGLLGIAGYFGIIILSTPR